MADQRRLVTDFCERLYHRKGQDKYRQPLHVVIDEADEFVPQRIQTGQERMFGAIDRLVRRGRSSGIGVTLISQRAAVINKDVLTQIEVLICLRTISPQDRKALEAWVEAHDAHDQRGEFMASLASLAIGEAWIWSPGWLDLFKRVQIRERKTFDSSATPKVGEAAKWPTATAVVDLEKLRAELASTIEKAKAEDPRELRKKIAALEVELGKASGKMPVATVDAAQLRKIQKESYDQGFIEADRAAAGKEARLRRALAAASDALASAHSLLNRKVSTPPVAGHPHTPTVRPVVVPTPARRHVRSTGLSSSIPGGERKILTALAQYLQGRSKTQVAILTAYAARGGAFANYLGALRSKGMIEGKDLLRITKAGLAALGPYDPLPTGRELLEHWLKQLGKAERLILSRLAEIHPAAASKEDLGAATGYEPSGGAFNNAIGKLRTLELVTGRGELRASEDLFA